MAVKALNPTALDHNEDWDGNNAAFTCPLCEKVFLVSGYMHEGERQCPNCNKSTGRVEGGKKTGGTASIRWEPSN
jgi:rubrerythrin